MRRRSKAGSDFEWRSYVPAGERRRRAASLVAQMRESGREVDPIVIQGRGIARTFWGRAWCENIEAYSDYANRLPRGKTYVRNGSVIDLQIDRGSVSALVSGSEFYEVELRVKPLSAAKWKRIRSRCAGQIDTLVELLRGELSDGVMEIVTKRKEGLFPAPREIALDCSCPDWAVLCKHVAAVLYGVGARLDDAPELMFGLRGVDPGELVTDALGKGISRRRSSRSRVLETDDLAGVFGVDIDAGDVGRRTRRKKPGAARAKKPASPRSKTKTKTKTKTRASKRATKKSPRKSKRPRRKS